MPFANPHPLYRAWANMKQRCGNPNHPQFRHYGGRGIKVCERWESSFKNFADDMGERPAGTSLDRINNDAGYFPENCRWATRVRQSRNQRKTRKVVVGGRELVASDLAEALGLKTDTIMGRAARGLTAENIMSPVRAGYNIAQHSGDPASVAKRVKNSRSRSQCRHGHPWPEFQKINKLGAVECIQCGRDKALRSKRRKRLLDGV